MGASGPTNSTVQDSGARTDVSGPGRYVVGAGIVLLLASVSLNVFLASKVESFRRRRSFETSERLLKVGTFVAPITANRLGGQQEIISFVGTNQPTVLYIFTPPCVWCARNMDNF